MEFVIPTVSSLCCEPSPLSLFFSSHLLISLQASYRCRNGSQKPQGHLTDPASVTPTDGASQILLKCVSPVNPSPGRRALSCHRTPHRRNPCTVAVPLAEPHSPHLLHGGLCLKTGLQAGLQESSCSELFGDGSSPVGWSLKSVRDTWGSLGTLRPQWGPVEAPLLSALYRCLGSVPLSTGWGSVPQGLC